MGEALCLLIDQYMPLQKYYCDYCDKSFNDAPEIRKKHSESAGHLRAVKQHYDAFKDPTELLFEQQNKELCPSFVRTGRCELGPYCGYYHKLQDAYHTAVPSALCGYTLSALPLSLHPPPLKGYRDPTPATWGTCPTNSDYKQKRTETENMQRN